MRIGTFNLNWPWFWLKGSQQPGEFAVPLTVQPVVDVGGQTWPPVIQAFTSQTALILGTNQIDLPRGPDIGRVRLWTQLHFSLDIVTAGLIVFLLFFDTRTATSHVITVYKAGGYVAGESSPLLGGSLVDGILPGSLNVRDKLYVPGQFQLARVLIAAAAGTETLELRGLFTEADENQPLYFPIP